MSGLRVAALRIQDFRVFAHLVVDLDPEETVILGENNAGKTAILDALDCALEGRRSTADDLHVASDGTRAESFVLDLLLAPGGRW